VLVPMCVHVHVLVPMCVHISNTLCVYTREFSCACADVRTYTFVWIYIPVWANIYIRIYKSDIYAGKYIDLCVCVDVCVCINIYFRTDIYMEANT